MAIPEAASEARASTSRTPAGRVLFAVLGWGLGGGICAAGSWAAGLVIANVVTGIPVSENTVIPKGGLAWAVFCAVLGNAVGGLVGLLYNRPARVFPILVLCAAGASGGALGGGLTPLVVAETRESLGPLASSSLAWAFAGFVAAAFGRALFWLVRATSEVKDDDPLPDTPATATWAPRRRGRSIAAWPVRVALAAGVAWALGSFVAGLVLADPISPDARSNLADECFTWAIVGGGCGIILGAGAGLITLRPNFLATSVALGVAAGLCGAIGGGLTPLVVVAAAEVLHPLVSSSLAWTVAGLIGTVAGQIVFQRTAKIEKH
jgi:hypothetical protein